MMAKGHNIVKQSLTFMNKRRLCLKLFYYYITWNREEVEKQALALWPQYHHNFLLDCWLKNRIVQKMTAATKSQTKRDSDTIITNTSDNSSPLYSEETLAGDQGTSTSVIWIWLSYGEVSHCYESSSRYGSSKAAGPKENQVNQSRVWKFAESECRSSSLPSALCPTENGWLSNLLHLREGRTLLIWRSCGSSDESFIHKPKPFLITAQSCPETVHSHHRTSRRRRHMSFLADSIFFSLGVPSWPKVRETYHDVDCITLISVGYA